MQWDVAGFELVELIGFGVLGEVWRAVDRDTGQVVALRRLEPAHVLEEVRRRAAVLRSLPGEHVIRVRSVRPGAVVFDHASAGSLAALLARRGALSPGEIVTAIAPVALALAEAHQRGLVHGRISAREVLLTHDGKPRLDGLALSFLYDAEPCASRDVQALGQLARELLHGAAAPEPMERAIAEALDADPPCTAVELAEGLLRACRAEPLAGLAAPGPPLPLPLPVPELVRRRSRRSLVVGLAAVVLLGSVTLVRLRADPPSPLARTGATPTPVVAAPLAAPEPEPDWQQLLDELDQARAAAFAAADPLALAQVYVTGSPALAADRSAMSQLSAAHLTARGLRHVLGSVQAVRLNPLQVELHVVAALSGYDLVGADGRVQHRAPGPQVQRVVALRRTSGEWRVESTST